MQRPLVRLRHELGNGRAIENAARARREMQVAVAAVDAVARRLAPPADAPSRAA